MDDFIVVDKDILGGTPVFAGTRVPLRSLIDYIEAGKTINDFVKDFPSVSLGQVKYFLESASAAIGKVIHGIYL
jgi:uncharacterized protein (DUF433 family)